MEIYTRHRLRYKEKEEMCVAYTGNQLNTSLYLREICFIRTSFSPLFNYHSTPLSLHLLFVDDFFLDIKERIERA